MAKSAIPTIIQMEQITKTYGSGNVEVHALEAVDFTVLSQEYCAIMGPSGSGKSTLMNMIGCLDRPTAGRYQLDGLDVEDLDEDDLAEVRNRKIGFVFQQFHLLPHADAVENVMLPMIYAGVPPQERRDRAVAALTRVGLGDRLSNRPNQLSGGQQQRVAIARAIVNQPVLLLADEPTGALDSQTTHEVLELFGELHASGITVVIVTHEADVAAQTERVVWMSDGQILHSHLAPDAVGAAQGKMLAAPE
ncbi:MAG: ABC transporter ATP-binding protein [Spirulina sp. SIO3F2]|nr:ABC transporter ATP-binding protein [Spirulina sp. SIO3F2]